MGAGSSQSTERLPPTQVADAGRRSLSPLGVLVVGAITLTSMGLCCASLGPALEELARHTGESLAGIGSLFTAFFLGSVTSQLIAGPLTDRFGHRPLIGAGSLALSLGTALISVSPTLPLLLGSAALAGLGLGTLNVDTNLLIAAVFAERAAAALNLVAVFFGVGAIGGPMLAAASLSLLGSAIPVLWLGAALPVLILPVLSRLPAVATVSANIPKEPSSPVYRDLFVLALGVLLALYTGLENTLGAWTTTYLIRSTGARAATAALITSGYWLCLTLGRAIGAALGQRLPSERLLRLCLAGAAMGGALFSLSVGQPLLTKGALLWLGLCLGPVYPTCLAVTTANVRHAPGAAVSLVAAMGSAGSMLFPWLEGTLLEKVSLSAGAALVGALAAMMLLLQLSPLTRPRKRRSGEG